MNLAVSTDALKTGFRLVSRTLYFMSVYPNLEFVFHPLAENNAKCALLYAFKNKIGRQNKQTNKRIKIDLRGQGTCG